MYEKNGNKRGSTDYNIFFGEEVLLRDGLDVKNNEMRQPGGFIRARFLRKPGKCYLCNEIFCLYE